MGTLKFKYKIERLHDGVHVSLPTSQFKKFNSSILDLGEISQDGKYFEALAAIFDLESFTSFCNQIDPHLVIPEYMNEFLNWLFQSISKELTNRKTAKQTLLWCHLPFYAKFVGDGVLFLWDTSDFDLDVIGNVVVGLLNICVEYENTFYPKIKKKVSRPPVRLRCGIARGQIISVGEERDFVGPCINVAARLQKFGQFSFAFSNRGFDLERCFNEETRKMFVSIRAPVRGVGEEELLFVLRAEFNALTKKEQKALLP
jgi:hypothetical protein